MATATATPPDIKSTAGPIVLERPKPRGTAETFASRGPAQIGSREKPSFPS